MQACNQLAEISVILGQQTEASNEIVQFVSGIADITGEAVKQVEKASQDVIRLLNALQKQAD